VGNGLIAPAEFSYECVCHISIVRIFR
jgi:hypothetical protein